MKQVLIQQGSAVVTDVPAPSVEAGHLLVQVRNSCISIGTEMGGVRASGQPLWRRALKQPQNVRKVLQMVAENGWSKTSRLIGRRLATGMPTGYSASGTVMAVGAGVTGFQVGDRVACAGAQCAFHAEIIRVPTNLAVRLAPNVDHEAGSTVTLGAIALQGIRRASPTLGETFVVIGLGVLGQLTVQMLRANGVRVIGLDVDRNRIRQALASGMSLGIHPEDGDDIQQVARLTGGVGADCVIITAASSSDAIISSAFRMCRKKGRVVLVGDVGLQLNRADFYVKEIDFFISTSYGPGRYDARYEEQGLDYPVSYVRWTENRNMSEYVQLLSEGRVRVDQLISSVVPIANASQAYAALKEGTEKPLMVLLSYPAEPCAVITKVMNPAAKISGSGRIRIALIGAGNFAKGVHLPNLQSLHDRYHIHCVMSQSGHNAVETAKQFGAQYSTTDFDTVLADANVDAVLITTRHDKHASMVMAALAAGKNVLVEKPLTILEHELSEITEFYQSSRDERLPLLMTGYNRRFSPYAVHIKKLLADRSNPMIINYRMNAGYIPLDHWVHSGEGGGRNIGEACHIYDLFTFLTGARVVDVSVMTVQPNTSYYARNDNFVATMRFDDGSVASLTYTAMGAKEHPKEKMEIFCDGKVIMLDDYKKLTVDGLKCKPMQTKGQDKGQLSELVAFADGLASGEWPIPLWQQLQVARVGFMVESSINSQRQE